VKVYVFRDPHFAPAGDTVIAAAPLDSVVRAFGGGGIKNTDGLHAVFGGAIVFQEHAGAECYLGVWGARKAAKFKATIKRHEQDVEIVESAPPAKLAWYQTEAKRKP
jgi:hypothetical protein